ncbi:hypothetical protein AVEN_192542-1 [Araneus ventricosus]|uniref:Uncharacterized protein n=1 Tax=Araneus ventricosus TaxID=182803 RepID=A0A4Y2FSM2_ARAVE|nr:hypothetical protein AVEN_192542-1 [Araneus ventricosus]
MQLSGFSERITSIEKATAKEESRQKVPLASTITTYSKCKSDDLTTEEREELLINSRSIDRLLKWSDCFSRCKSGLCCNYCGTTLCYDYSLGESFSDAVLPDCFRHLKYDLKRHLESNKHILCAEAYNAELERQGKMQISGKGNGLNCANAAYLIYKNSMPYRAYEDLITIMHNSGCSMGVKNHSKEFPRIFLPVVHSVLKTEVSSFILNNDLPVGVVADKVIVHCRSHHVIGLRVPIFELNKEHLFKCIYLEHNFVDNFTGGGLAASILNTLKKFDFSAPFLRNNLVGLAVDGQYIKLGVAEHIRNELVMDKIAANWDQMHEIELMQKHADTPSIVNAAHSLIHDSMKVFMFGGKYEDVLKCSQDFDEYFYRSKLFKTMKFASYSKEVFRTFIGDYKYLVAACERRPDMCFLRDKLIAKSTLFHIFLLSDLYTILSHYSKCVQLVNNLP